MVKKKSSSDIYDYVIVGAGAAGSVVAARLGEDRGVSICVLEAGPSDLNPFIHIPAGFIKILGNPNYTWPFTTEPSEGSGGRRVSVTQGRVVGGSSSINGMVYNRGLPGDFDEWAQRGNRGWSYAEVLPYFKKSERRIGFGAEETRGRTGEIPITDMDWFHPISEAFIQGAVRMGIPRNPDYNSGDQAGVGYYQRSIHRGRRISAARGFLIPALRRGNIDLRTDARACSILIEGKRAAGVRYLRQRGGPTTDVLARREVILCAGSANTARLMQVSGIGPGPLLSGLGIPVRHDLPGVGENLKDHYSIRAIVRMKARYATLNQLARGPRLLLQIARWAVGLPSILATVPSHVYVFWKSRDTLTEPDLQFMFSPGSYVQGKNYVLDDYPGVSAGVSQHRPHSSGHVRAVSSDVFVDPLIQPNYLKDPVDQQTILAGFKIVRQLLSTPEFVPFVDSETLPGLRVQSDNDLMDFIRARGATGFHLVGTAKMGPSADATAVVDEALRVHGIGNLRVADASIMPNIPSANTYASTLMIAEKASDLIRNAR